MMPTSESYNQHAVHTPPGWLKQSLNPLITVNKLAGIDHQVSKIKLNLHAIRQKLYRTPFYLWLSAMRRYRANKAVFQSIKPLSGELSYFSVSQQQIIPESAALAAIQQGDVIIVRQLIDKLGLQQDFTQLSQQYFACDVADLSQIHLKQTVHDIVRQARVARSSPLSLQLQSSIMHRLLSPHTRQMYLELQPNIRLHLPYAFVKDHEAYIEQQIGRGKLNPHGQHKDSWRGHPKNTINVWLALTEANAQNGMGILLHSLDYHPKHDPDGQEIQPGVKTYPSQHYVTDLQAGDAVIFCAELLHGSVINQSGQTRVALSMRCAVEKPQFHQKYRYNYIGVEHGRFNNLTLAKSFAPALFVPESTATTFAAAEQKGSSLQPTYIDHERIDVMVEGQLKQFPRYCPHAGADLALGELSADGNHLICPAHRLCVKPRKCLA